jgi:hypothetical protein
VKKGENFYLCQFVDNIIFVARTIKIIGSFPLREENKNRNSLLWIEKMCF